MHFSLMLLAVGVACCMRLFPYRLDSSWLARWQQTLGQFIFSPLLLLMTAISVLDMGKAGQMLGLPVGEIGFSCALAFLSGGAVCLLWRSVQAWHSIQNIRRYPVVEVQNTVGHLLNTHLPFAAQVGIWRSNLVISRGLLAHLSPAQVEAVLTHEQAHVFYRDPFWFFWLGWLRQLTFWLPNTERLWQELLLLREMRADRWAATQVDALLIAEALLHMTQLPLMDLENSCAAISASAPVTRLEERIEALLSAEISASPESQASPIGIPAQSLLGWLLLALLPLLTVMLHR